MTLKFKLLCGKIFVLLCCMKITLSGYGKMGKEVEKIALERNHSILAIIDTQEDWDRFKATIEKSDVIIDFSQPDCVMNNIKNCFDIKRSAVIGTTGWDNQKEEIRKICTEQKQSLFVASNFSIGVNILFEINKTLARFMENQPAYDVSVEETHHVHKKDAPSGTAIQLVNQIIKEISRKKNWIDKSTENPSDLYINSIRTGEVPGEHSVKYFSEIDEIEIRHSANGRKGFAYGAILAAEWLIGKKGFFEMKDMIEVS